MIKRTNRNHRAQITFTLHLDERDAKSSLISIEYPVDYNEEPYLEEDRNITGWECPKECCYNTIVLDEEPKEEYCKKALNNFQKIRKKILKDENTEKTLKK